VPVVTNVTAEYVTDKAKVKELLVRQVSNSVLWEECVKAMLADGVDTFIEIGPGKTLSGFIKKISKEVRTLNVEDMDSLNKTLQELGK
jgi:[acyl-carrier-protein] S-malonyltransferase